MDIKTELKMAIETKLKMAIKTELFQKKKGDYGDNYEMHYFEQYKLCVEMADRISSRRHSANSFFLSVNTAIIAMISYFQSAETSNVYYLLVGVAGMALCFTWHRLIQSYKNLNREKFRVVKALEKRLPVAPYCTERKLRKISELYRPFTTDEMVVPWIFGILHFCVFAFFAHALLCG